MQILYFPIEVHAMWMDTPDKSKGLECYIDADFSGGWQKVDANDTGNVMSQTGFVIVYANCPVFWSIKLQTGIAFRTAEAEYIALLS